jgi:predicted RNase H-like HicB family nuclease
MEPSITHWQHHEHFIGHLDEMPEFHAQGRSLDELKARLLELYLSASRLVPAGSFVADPVAAYRMNRTVARVVPVEGDDERSLAYWLTKTAQERLSALEVLRSQMYGTDAATPPRLQRVHRVIVLPSS